jgi:hypothetical protein
LVGIGLLVLVGAIRYNQGESERKSSHQKIPISDVRVENLLFGKYNELSGRITSNSATYKLDSLSMKITTQDCSGQQCVTIAEATTYVSADIPAGQARDIAQTVYFDSPIQPNGTLQWYYVVTETTSR